jgi:hypothetical protein
LINQSSELTASVDAVDMTLAETRDSFKSNLGAVSSIMSELLSTVSFDLHRLGLDDDQEAFISEKVEIASRNIYSWVEKNMAIEEVLSSTVNLLERLCNEQGQIISQSLAPPSTSMESSDIELF